MRNRPVESALKASKSLQWLGKGGSAKFIKQQSEVLVNNSILQLNRDNADIGRSYAIKVMNKKWIESKGLRRRIDSEIRIHSKLSHPNIVKFVTHFEDSKFIYIVMKLCSNGNLYRKVRSAKKAKSTIPYIQKIRLFHQIVKGVEYLHSQSIVHRDLKLSNMLLDDKMNIQICDFGLAVKAENGQEQRTVCGTANYMAPEIAKNSPYIPVHADLWSLGCLLYSLLMDGKSISAKDFKTSLREIPRSARNMIKLLLNSNKPQSRPSCTSLLAHEMFKEVLLEARDEAKQLLAFEDCCRMLPSIDIGNIRGVKHKFGSHHVQIEENGDVSILVSGKVPVKITKNKIIHQGRQMFLDEKLPKFYVRVYNFAIRAVKILVSTTPRLVLQANNMSAALLPDSRIIKIWYTKADETATYDIDSGLINYKEMDYDLNDENLTLTKNTADVQVIQDIALKCLHLQAQLEEKQWCINSDQEFYFPLIVRDSTCGKPQESSPCLKTLCNDGSTSVVVEGLGTGFQHKSGKLRLILLDGTCITLDSSASIVTFDKERRSFALVKRKNNQHLPLLPHSHKSKLQTARKIIKMMR